MQFTHPSLDDVPLSAVLHALADKSRRTILRSLATDADRGGVGLPCSVAAPPNLPKATMSSHYSVLRAAGLIRSQRAGSTMVNCLRREETERRFPGLLDTLLRLRDD